jgi:hypothetical protein
MAEAGRLLLAAAVVVAALTPWTVRNVRVHGQLVPVKNSFGKELWIGNNPHATGTSRLEGGEHILRLHAPRFLERAEGVPLREMALMNAMRREALEHMRADPAGLARRTLRKILWLWTWVPARLVNAEEGGGTLVLRHLYTVCWLALAALAVLGAATGAGGPKEYRLVLLAVFAVYSATYGLTFVDHARFRAEVDYVVVPAAAQGLAAGLAAARRRRRPATKGDER